MKKKEQTDTGFEEHVKQWRAGGFKGPLWTVDMLSQVDLEMINGHAWTKIRETRDKDPEADMLRIYLEVLTSFGVICPHPQSKRLYSSYKKSYYPLINHRWYSCEICFCLVINEHWDASTKERTVPSLQTEG